MPLRKIAFVTALIVAGLSAAHGQVTVYTTKGAFDTAAQATGSLAFTYDLNTAAGTSGNVTLGAVTITNPDAYGFPNLNAQNSVDSTGYYRFDVDGSTTVTFTLANPVTAFGFETNPHSNGLGITLTATVGGTSVGYTNPVTDVTEFRGFVSSSPFTTFVISNPGSTTETYGIDNLVGYASAIPEPGSYATLVGLFIAGFTVLHSRRRPSGSHATS